MKSLFTLSITLVVLNILLFNPLANLTASGNSDIMSSEFVVNEQVHKEKDLTYSLSAGGFLLRFVVHVNYTVLACSNASVFFRYYYDLYNYTIWSPNPGNLTLATGESFAGNFTVINVQAGGYAKYGYYASIEEGTNATVHW